ncbi:MAG: amidohydrolase, partial [Pseudomonadota bacterium]
MLKRLLAASAAGVALFGVAHADLKEDVAADADYVEALYKHLHANPELSFKEEKTSARLAKELADLGFDVTTGVGSKWTRRKAKADAGEVLDGVDGYGVVGVLRNGEGPTVLIRADMDALPLQERSGVSYASKARDVDYLGQEAPVMHACGHDVHMATLVGTARRLAAMQEDWSGTLVMVGQPAEEIALGALAMIDDGLFKKYPKPDYNLALHVTGQAPAGIVSYTEGYALAAVDSVDIIVKGVGGHGAAPHLAKDPIVIGAQIVNALQTLVSREVNPIDDGVVTVGQFQAGYKHNIIPDKAHLKLTVRSYKKGVRDQLIEGIKRIARAQAASAGLPEDLMPEIRVEQDNLISTYNEPSLTKRVSTTLRKTLGAQRVVVAPPVMGGEDFAYFGKTDEEIPSFIFWLGGADPAQFAAYQAGGALAPASNHSPFF